MTPGSTLVGPFSVAGDQTTTLSVPSLALTATPLGGWTIAVHVTIKSIGYTVSQYAYQLTETDGTTTHESVLTTATSQTHSWGNTVAFPTGVSTASITVTALKSGKPNKTGTATATTSITAGATQSTGVSVTL